MSKRGRAAIARLGRLVGGSHGALHRFIPNLLDLKRKKTGANDSRHLYLGGGLLAEKNDPVAQAARLALGSRPSRARQTKTRNFMQQQRQARATTA